MLLALPLAGCLDTGADQETLPGPPGFVFFDADQHSLDESAWKFAAPIPVVRPLERAAREPTLGVDPDGNVFVGVWDQEDYTTGELDDDDLGTVLSVYASFDQGLSWRNVRPPPLEIVQIPPTTSDAFLEVDPVTGRIIANDWTFACSTTAVSDDQGGSWLHSPLGCGPGIGHIDHQSVTTGEARASTPVGYSRMVYYCVAGHCSSSLDGGLTFGIPSPVFCPGPLPIDAACMSAIGHVKTDDEGRVMVGGRRGGLPVVSVSEDDGQTWTPTVVNETLPPYYHDVEVAADENGTLYAVWNAIDGMTYLATSGDHGVSWGPAVNVVPPGLTVTSYPMVAAGKGGAVAIVFLGTDHGPAGYAGAHPSQRMGDMVGARWNWYFSISLDADVQSPTFAALPINDPDDPAAVDACWPGFRHCDDVGEFVDIVIGPDGRPWASVFDSCQQTCAQTGQNEPRGGHRGAVLTLSQGPTLRGEHGELQPLEYLQT